MLGASRRQEAKWPRPTLATETTPVEKTMVTRFDTIPPSMMAFFEVQQGVISAFLEACRAADPHLKVVRQLAEFTEQLKSYEQGPVAPVLNPQVTDDGGIEGGIQRALKILKVDDRMSARWNVDDREDVQAESLARVQQRLSQMQIRVLLRLGWPGLRKIACQELADVLDKREAKRRGGTGGRKARKAKKSIRAALHIPLEDLLDEPESPDIPTPAAFILAVASKLGRAAHQYFRAIAAGADQKSAAEVAGISDRMGRKYKQKLRLLLKN